MCVLRSYLSISTHNNTIIITTTNNNNNNTIITFQQQDGYIDADVEPLASAETLQAFVENNEGRAIVDCWIHLGDAVGTQQQREEVRLIDVMIFIYLFLFIYI